MKHIYKIILMVAALFTMCGCGLDNYETPSLHLNGRIVYDDATLFLRHGAVALDLYQEGYEKNEPIKVYIAQDGTFSALLYAGTYTLTAINGTGPWTDGATPVNFTLSADKSLDFEVTPFFVMSDVAIVLNGTTVKAVCNVKKIAGDKSARRLSLFVGRSAIVGDNTYNYVARANQMPANVGGNSLSCDVSAALDANDALYARLGLQIDGVSEMIYSETVKIK